MSRTTKFICSLGISNDRAILFFNFFCLCFPIEEIKMTFFWWVDCLVTSLLQLPSGLVTRGGLGFLMD